MRSRFKTTSSQETVQLGEKLGLCLLPHDVIVLSGELGCGKTWFTKGIASGIGVPSSEVITSPSFSLMNQYEGRCSLFHMDVYRLETLQEFLDTGLDEYFEEMGIVVMEWGDKWPEILPEHRLVVKFSILGEENRELRIQGDHFRVKEILKRLTERV